MEEIIDEQLDTSRKKRVADPFVIYCKKYFSSLTARQSRFCVFNLFDSKYKVVMLSARKKLTFEEYLLQYAASDMGLQYIEFKYTAVIDLMYEKLCLPADRPIVLNMSILLRYLNMAVKNKNMNQLLFATNGTAYGLKYMDEEVHYGYDYTDHRTIVKLKLLTDALLELNSIDLISKQIHLIQTIEDTTDLTVTGNVISLPVSIEQFTVPNGLSIDNFNRYKPNFYLIMFDGKDTVSLKEYIKKVTTDYTYKIISWIEPKTEYVRSIVHYEDTELMAISTRPNNCIYFILNKQTTEQVR